MVSGIRKYNGKIFTYSSTHYFKNDMEHSKKRLKNSGYKVRVVIGRKSHPTGRRQLHLFIRNKKLK